MPPENVLADVLTEMLVVAVERLLRNTATVGVTELDGAADVMLPTIDAPMPPDKSTHINPRGRSVFDADVKNAQPAKDSVEVDKAKEMPSTTARINRYGVSTRLESVCVLPLVVLIVPSRTDGKSVDGADASASVMARTFCCNAFISVDVIGASGSVSVEAMAR